MIVSLVPAPVAEPVVAPPDLPMVKFFVPIAIDATEPKNVTVFVDSAAVTPAALVMLIATVVVPEDPSAQIQKWPRTAVLLAAAAC